VARILDSKVLPGKVGTIVPSGSKARLIGRVQDWSISANRTVAREAAGTESPFKIDVRFLGGLTDTQQKAFKDAARRWTSIIVGDLPAVVVDGEEIDDILIVAEGVSIDGAGTILGQAGPTRLRPRTAGTASLLPAKGIMKFDSADLGKMESAGTLVDVITHEMGHVLGIGTLWGEKNLLRGVGTMNPRFTGPRARKAYGILKGSGLSTDVPVENRGGIGTRDSHWREAIFLNELMSGFVAEAGNPISSVTVGSLEDIGYTVAPDAAEHFELANVAALAEAGKLERRDGPFARGVVLPNIPTVLPDESLVAGGSNGRRH